MPRDYDDEPDTLRRIERKIDYIIKMTEATLATEADLQAAIAQIQADVTSVGQTLAAEIQKLQDSVTNGTVSAADLEGLKALHAQLTDPNFAQPAPPAPPANTLTVTASDFTTASGQPYGGTPVTVSGGTAPYTVNLSGLPDGLNADTSGNVTGTPTAPGTSTVSVSVTDNAGATATSVFTVTVT